MRWTIFLSGKKEELKVLGRALSGVFFILCGKSRKQNKNIIEYSCP